MDQLINASVLKVLSRFIRSAKAVQPFSKSAKPAKAQRLASAVKKGIR